MDKETEIEILPDHFSSKSPNQDWNLDESEAISIKPLIETISTSTDVQQSIDAFLTSNDENYEKLLTIAVKSLFLFIQRNFTGPFEGDDQFVCLKERTIRELATYEEVNENVVNLELLYFAKIVFQNEKLQNRSPFNHWWLMRVNIVFDMILNETSKSLSLEIEKKISDVKMMLQCCSQESAKDMKNEGLTSMLFAEVAHYYIRIKEITKSEQHLNVVQQLLKLELNLEGALGKRTKFQCEDKPQLFLNIKTEGETTTEQGCLTLPKPLDLNDDVRLNKIHFANQDVVKILSKLETSVILCKCFQLQFSQPKDELLNEELIAYLEPIIDGTTNWPLRMSALYQRCKLEANHKRTVERSMVQMEHLLEQMKSQTTNVEDRRDLFFCSAMKPVWFYEQSLADLMLNLGMIKTALDLYLKLQLWEEVIVCYTILELKHKAAEIIEQELAKKKTVKLLCLLGDVTNNEKCYEEAWELSKHGSSRAQRHWGLYYFSKKNYTDAIPHLKLSVELNHIQENVWLKLGYAALITENWEIAADAYRKYCELEKQNFEAWNNLAKAYIKLGHKQRAWYCLREAVKFNYDRWEVWDNLMVTSADLKNFSEVIKCYHRILDLKGQHVDLEVLEILKTNILKEIECDGKINETVRDLLKESLKLMGHLTSLVHNNSGVWMCYGALTSLCDHKRASLYLQRAYKIAVSDTNWHSQVDSILNVLVICIKLAETYLQCVQAYYDHSSSNIQINDCISMLGSGKLSLQSVIKLVKTKIETENVNNEEVVQLLKQVEDKLKLIVDKIEELKALN